MSEAVEILVAAWGHLSRNWTNTIKVFLIPVLLAILFMIFIFISVVGYYNSTPLFMVSAIIWIIMTMLAIFWGAIKFHRYILLDETPQWIGEIRIGLSAKYTIFAAGIAILAGLIVALPLLLLFQAMGVNPIVMLVGVIFAFIALYLIARLSPMLVEISLEKGRGIREIWAVSKPHNIVFWGLALIAFGLEFLSNFVDQFSGSMIGAIISIIVNIFLALIALAMLTETYRRYFTE